MMTHYLRQYQRHFRRNATNISMAVGGLALGIAVFLLSVIYVTSELRFDAFHIRQNEIYRIVYGEEDLVGSAYTAYVMGSILKESFADIHVVRLNNAGGVRIPISYNDTKFVESQFYFTDPEIFDVFSFTLLQGDPETCLREPFKAIITPNMAVRYFGSDDPIGKSLKFDWAGVSYNLEVTGIIEAPPYNSHIQFEFLISDLTAQALFTPKSFFTDWTANFCYNYLLVPEGKLDVVAAALQKAYSESVPSSQHTLNTRLQPLNRIHLHSKLLAELSKNSDLLYLYIAATLGLLIILAASINYVNIQLAVYSKRLRELGVRKVLGATMSDIGLQFAIECIVNVAISGGIALLCIDLASSYFTEHFDERLSFSVLLNSNFIGATITVSGLAFLLILYIIYSMAYLKPGDLVYGKSKLLTRKKFKSILVGVQIGISVILMVGSLSINRQLAFLEDRGLGFDKEHVIATPYGSLIASKADLARDNFVNLIDIKSMSLSSQIPPSNLNFRIPCFPEGGNPDGSAQPWDVALVVIDEHFVETFNLSLTEGRSFSDAFRKDTTESFLINETFARQLNWNESIGKRIEINFNPGTGAVETRTGHVVGVIKDFHFESLHRPLTPIVFMYKPSAFFFASFLLTPGDTKRKVEQLKEKWSRLFPETPFDFFFLNARFEALYKVEEMWSTNVSRFTAIAVVISLFGIFSLVSFLVQSRQSEFAIRKTLGASGFSIARLISFNVLKIILMAFIITIPVCYVLVNLWLNNFAYKAAIDYSIYLFSLVSLVALCFIVISGNLIKASMTSITANLRTDQ